MSMASKRIEILPAKRRAMILDHLRSHGATAITELAAALGGSHSTIRRDLEHLVEGGYLERTHGGALLRAHARTTFEREPSINAEMRQAEKAAIGKAAAAMLQSGESVIFDGSSTVLEAVRAAAARGIALTAITNSLDTASFCSDVAGWRVIVPGGTLRAGTRLLVGDTGGAFFEGIHADVCMTGALAVTGTTLTDASLEVAAIKKAMMRAARRKILLVDSSKFTTPAFCTFADLTGFDHLVTDGGLGAGTLDQLRMLRTEITLVPLDDAE